MHYEINMKMPCIDRYGKTHKIPIEKFSVRISANGVLKNGNKVLMVKDTWQKKWEFPGGGANIDESLEEAVAREFEEETGLKVKIVKFICFKEGYLYQEDKDRAWHTYRFFFEVEKISGEIRVKGNGDDVLAAEFKNPKSIDSKDVIKDIYKVVEILSETKYSKFSSQTSQTRL